MMKLIRIEAWNQPDSRHTYLRRSYTNPGIEHTVWLHPDKIVTSLYNGNMNQAFKPGIQHLTRP